MQPWKVLRTDVILDMPWFTLRRDTCELPDGSVIDDYFVLDERDSVLVFALTAEDDLLLVQQYKHGIGEAVTELPAGFMEPGETDPNDTARRELREETGCEARAFTVLATMARHPTRMTGRVHIVLAEGVRQAGEQQLDKTEFIRVLRVPFEEAFARLARVSPVGTVAGLYMAREHLGR